MYILSSGKQTIQKFGLVLLTMVALVMVQQAQLTTQKYILKYGIKHTKVVLTVIGIKIMKQSIQRLTIKLTKVVLMEIGIKIM